MGQTLYLLDSVVAFLIRRLLLSALVLGVIVTVTFFLMKLAPGSPFSADRAIPAAILAELEAQYQLSGTWWQQYTGYLGDVVRGDLRASTKYRNRTVNEIIAQTLPVSMTLGGLAFLVSISLGVVLGAYAAVYHHRGPDRVAMFLALLGLSTPSFVLAPLLILIVAIYWGWLPVAGWGLTSQLILPVICLAAPFTAMVARLMRGSLLEVLGQDYIRTARAKGLAENTVIFRHALKAGIMPVLSFSGPLAANLLTGSMVVEQIFNLPGIGSFFVNSVLSRDIFMVGGVVLVYSVFLLGFNVLVDLACAALDRRIHLS